MVTGRLDICVHQCACYSLMISYSVQLTTCFALSVNWMCVPVKSIRKIFQILCLQWAWQSEAGYSISVSLKTISKLRSTCLSIYACLSEIQTHSSCSNLTRRTTLMNFDRFNTSSVIVREFRLKSQTRGLKYLPQGKVTETLAVVFFTAIRGDAFWDSWGYLVWFMVTPGEFLAIPGGYLIGLTVISAGIHGDICLDLWWYLLGSTVIQCDLWRYPMGFWENFMC